MCWWFSCTRCNSRTLKEICRARGGAGAIAVVISDLEWMHQAAAASHWEMLYSHFLAHRLMQILDLLNTKSCFWTSLEATVDQMHQLRILGPIWIQIGPTATILSTPWNSSTKNKASKLLDPLSVISMTKKHTERTDLFWNRDTPQLHSPDL